MGVKEESKNIAIDHDWIKLIHEAKALGLTPDEVRIFLMTKRANIQIN